MRSRILARRYSGCRSDHEGERFEHLLDRLVKFRFRRVLRLQPGHEVVNLVADHRLAHSWTSRLLSVACS